ncbi:MAG TPA: CdaR family protein [Bryobacteraceae bacterium]|nr:CdaR family protein [Bryobacteraceae bacterium]
MKWGKMLLGLVTRNPGWKLLSLAIAVVVWAVVANEPELSTFTTAGIEYKNLPDNLEISSEPVSTVKLELSGPSGQLSSLADGASPEVILDMTDVRSGERTFPIGNGNVKLVRGVHLVRAIPAEVRLRFERHAERMVKVVPRFRTREGYDVAAYTVTPDSIEIAGPASHVAQVDTVQTDEVNIPARAGTFDYPVNTYVDDPYVRFPDVSRVTVSATIKKR